MHRPLHRPKFPSADVFNRANAHNILKFLQDYVLLHSIPRAIGLYQAKCQIEKQIKAFCNHENIQVTEAQIHDHRAIGLVERLIQTMKSRLVGIKTDARNNFNSKDSINSIIYQLRMCRQKTIDLSLFEGHFGRKAYTSLINTEPNSNTLSYEPVLNQYLDLETVHWDALIPEHKWDGGTRSDVDFETTYLEPRRQ